MDGTSFLLRGNYQRRPNAIARCASEALKRGYRVMGIQHGGWCASGPRAQLTYAKYGKSNKCRNGKGGPWANDVYRISGEFCLQILVQGKFKTSNRLIELGNLSLETFGHTLHWWDLTRPNQLSRAATLPGWYGCAHVYEHTTELALGWLHLA